MLIRRHRLTRRIVWWGSCVWLFFAVAAPVAAVELEGTWHVLVHYQDRGTDHPEREHWEDRVWVFAREGDRLRWTDYPIVVFSDASGRFERLGTNRQSRVLGYWEPNSKQQREIESGLQVNPRGSKSKTLRQRAEGWSSSSRARATSVNVLTYTETWKIEGDPALPIFIRADSMSSGMTDSFDGQTRYATESVEAGVLSGLFDRDGTRHGRFRMQRSGKARDVEGSGKTQSERLVQMGIDTYFRNPDTQAAIASELEAALAEAGVYLTEEASKAWTGRVLELIGQGKSVKEVRRAIDKDLVRNAEREYFGFAEKDARHDDSVRYRIPFESQAPRKLIAGVLDGIDHTGVHRYSFDFKLPMRDPIVAARDGEVALVIDGYENGGPSESLRLKTNAVVVLHEDQTFANYVHLSPGVLVKPGQQVSAGELLGYSGNTGYTMYPQLHFSVWRLDDDGKGESVPIRFDDGSDEGVVPQLGLYYGGPDEKVSVSQPAP